MQQHSSDELQLGFKSIQAAGLVGYAAYESPSSGYSLKAVLMKHIMLILLGYMVFGHLKNVMVTSCFGGNSKD